MMGGCGSRWRAWWKTLLVVLVPLLLVPLAAVGGTKAARTGYVIIVMAVFWMTEALPLAVTSLIPVVLLPLLGIMSTGDVCTCYMKESNMMFLGGIMVALSVEHCNLHTRLALRVLSLFGTRPRWLMLGFMLITMFLSMWISNTATTAMMVPIVDAVVDGMAQPDQRDRGALSRSRLTVLTTVDSDHQQTINEDKNCNGQGSLSGSQLTVVSSMESSEEDQRRLDADKEHKNLRVCMLLAVAYSANIGGTGSLIGSTPQLALKGILEELYGSKHGLTFATWMALNVPGMLINTILAWVWLQILFLGFKKDPVQSAESGGSGAATKVLQQKYKDLGRISFHEGAVLLLFIVCVFLWFLRDPHFITGWAQLLPDVKIDDSTSVIGIVLLMFIIPARPQDLFSGSATNGSGALLDWKFAQSRIPWGLLLLLGGGFAISDASKVTGLSQWLGTQMAGLSALPPFGLLVVVCLMTAALTEVASNTATASILLPILAQMATTIGINPLLLMIPATVTCSYAFMLPVATPPNAIVFAAAKMTPGYMIKAGLLMNVLCVVVICVLMQTLGNHMFDVYSLPDWVPAV